MKRQHSWLAIPALFLILAVHSQSATWGTTNRVWNIGATIDSSPAIDSAGVAYVGSWDNNVYALNPDGTTGRVWTTFGSVISAPMLGTNHDLYVASGDGKLYEFDLQTGNTSHVWVTTYTIYSSPALASNGNIYVPCGNIKLYSFNPDGATNHVWHTGAGIVSSPVIGNDGSIYLGAQNNVLYSFNPDGTTNRMWHAGDMIDGSVALDVDQNVYVGCRDHTLCSFNPDGTTNRMWHTGIYAIQSSPAIAPDGTVYIGALDGNLYGFAVDGTTGHVWNTTDAIYASPTIGSDGTIYVGSWDGQFYAFNPDGTTDMVWTVDGKVNYSSAAVATNGWVYVGDSGGKVYAFQGTGGILAEFGWPKFRYDLTNRARDQRQAATVPVFRLYSYGAPESTYEHLWTTSEAEKDTLDSWPSWTYEGIAWYAYTNQVDYTTPLYRLYCPSVQQHHYTIDATEYTYLDQQSPDWNGEGIQYYVYPTNSVAGALPAYRFYHPTLYLHHFTISETEKESIINNPSWGYEYEGVGYYVLPTARANRGDSKSALVKLTGDYNGDGLMDAAWYEESSGGWYIMFGVPEETSQDASRSMPAVYTLSWGGPGLTPLAEDVDGDGACDMAIYSESTDAWFVRTLDGRVLVWNR